MYENIILEIQDQIGIIRVNRPKKLNALNIPTREEILSALAELGKNADVRVIVFTGTGDKAFIAGADISEFEGRTALDQRAVMRATRMFDSFSEFPKPVIAMINGFCLGGGCEAALSCDIRIASDNAKFGQPEINLGIIPGGGGTQRLTRLVGEGKAMEMILTGDMIDANEAKAIGLVNHVVPQAELEEFTMKMARKIAEKSPVALQMGKEAVKNASRMNLREGLDQEMIFFALCFSSADKEEGVKAFLEKRKAVFTGK
ncbi:MAG: enoyl-CoA hydratase/isomerase family protein [Blastocatellia bacterium]|nr:enoyl-CoA hydratase/isomerase family protein [Blastocatellia bacterium]